MLEVKHGRMATENGRNWQDILSFYRPLDEATCMPITFAMLSS